MKNKVEVIILCNFKTYYVAKIGREMDIQMSTIEQRIQTRTNSTDL
jgi:hypothetical protein